MFEKDPFMRLHTFVHGRRAALALLLLVPLVSGCESLRPGALLEQSGEWLQRSGEILQDFGKESAVSEENPSLKALFAQPYIDPLTRYLDKNRHNAALQADWQTVQTERDRRCAVVAKRFEQIAVSESSVDRFRRGYAYSCSAEVAAYAARLSALQAQALANSNNAGSADSANSAEKAAASRSVTLGELPKASKPLKSETELMPSKTQQAGLQVSECYLLTSIKNYREALKACEPPAEQGDARAQTSMAQIFYLFKQYNQAFRWASLAGKKSAESSFLLAQMHERGQGTRADRPSALRWYEAAEKLGHPQARAEWLRLSGQAR